MTPIRFSLLAVLTAAALASAPSAHAEYQPAVDWPYLDAYRNKDAHLAPDPRRVVFMGDSITEFWDREGKALFTDPSLVNRGISGQTTPQMLLRFRQDVIDLKPRAVVILAGTNDIAGNTGPSDMKMITDNIQSMAELARAHGIRVVLGAVPPVARYPWSPEIKPIPRIAEENAWLKAYAKAQGFAFVDFFTPMADDRQGMRADLSEDGVHPNAKGYAVMETLLRQALSQLPAAN